MLRFIVAGVVGYGDDKALSGPRYQQQDLALFAISAACPMVICPSLFATCLHP
jgi:hypothetical protein